MLKNYGQMVVAVIIAVAGWASGYGMSKARIDTLVEGEKTKAEILQQTSVTLASVTARLESLQRQVDRSEARIHDLEVRK